MTDFSNKPKKLFDLPYIKNNRYKKILMSFIKSKILYGFAITILLIFLLDRIFPLPEQKSFSTVIYDKDGVMLTAYLSKDDKWRMQTHLNEVSPEFIKAVIEKEDSWFRWHFGFNPYSIIRAAFQNIISNKRVSGASTITMQVARMLQPAKRTYLNKLIEVLRAVQLELHYSKDEILELYFNLLPYGGNVEGVKSASYIYFNRPPNKLSLSQCILLTVIPNNPNELRLDREIKYAVYSRNKWIKYFREHSTFDVKELKDALEEPVVVNRFAIKNEAPHFCQYILNNYSGNDIATTLNLPIQKTAEKLLSNYVKRIRSKGISNGAAIIIENKTNSVTGYCGSNDFDDTLFSGQINGINAIRSPGSTLKPALYAFAFDEGILTPAMKLLDILTDFNGYEPEDFDSKYRGPVTASFALVNSLNIPAVQLLQQTGISKFISLLDKAGFTEISRNKNQLGLSLILGGCGVRLEQLIQLYSAFAHNGKLYPLSYLKQESLDKEKSISLVSPGASYLISTILNLNERPDFPKELLYSTNLPKIAWKTGTSYGKRDAWAIGFNPDYTIGVWLGNFDGRGAADLSGAGIAVPLLFELFNSIDFKPDKTWFDKPADVLERNVCSETGLLPGDYCKSLTKDYYIKNVSPSIKCDLYKIYYVNENETISYCTECLPKSGYKKVAYPSYKPELTLWYLKNKVQFKLPPPHNPLCISKHFGDVPKILSPLENYEYYLDKNTPQEVLLLAASDPSVKKQYWYIDDKFYKNSKPGDKIFFTPKDDTIKIACLDDLGRKESVTIKVIFY
jgi:penicillin-binding protein 1C